MTIRQEFHGAMLDIYRRAKAEARYTAKAFLDMVVERGGLETAKALIGSSRVSSGYVNLLERGRLDLTVEAMVVENPRWHELFTDAELSRARMRLREFGYRIAG